jgi:LmeA-like phospholipid-binding
MSEKNLETKTTKSIRIVTNVLTKALKLWLRSQVTRVNELDVQIKATDRQLLSGSIPWVSISANNTIYQGLHLTSIQLTAENIRIDIGSVLRGKPLKLQETIPVSGKVLLDESDLNASLTSGLLSIALKDALVKLIPEHSLNSKLITWEKIILGNNQLRLTATHNTEGNSIPSIPLDICIGLKLLSGHELQLILIESKHSTQGFAEPEREHYLDLGNDVDIQELTAIPGKLTCHGRINVNP